MTNEELMERLIDVKVRQLVIRDFIIWLLAREAAASPDAQGVLRSLSELSDANVDSMTIANDADLHLAEQFRGERDWIISAAEALAKRL